MAGSLLSNGQALPKTAALGIVLFNNSKREAQRLLRSIASAQLTDEINLEQFCWDNSATDGLRTDLGLQKEGLNYGWTGENLGFGVAHNRLMRQAFSEENCQWYVCVNPDAILHPRCIIELIEVAERVPRAGLVEARLFPDEHPKRYDPITLETAWCSGCVLLVTRTLFQHIGGFDENFFMYCEDVDLSWRARAAGFKTLIAPAALAHHYEQGRPVLKQRELSVRRSAAYLAHKYGAKDFELQMIREYHSLGGPPLELPPVGPTKPPRGGFDHFLRFSESRW